MRFTANLIIILILIPLFLIELIALTLRFQLLTPVFWQNAYTKNNVYSTLSTELKKSVISETLNGGGHTGDILFLTDLITPKNTKDSIDRNVDNVLGYMNGYFPTLNFYIPISKFPKNLLPKNITALPDQVSALVLMRILNINIISAQELQYLSLSGRTVTYALTLVSLIIALLLILLVFLVEKGKRLVAPGIALIIFGLLGFGLYEAGIHINQALTSGLLQNTSTTHVLFSILIPPLVGGIAGTWLIFGAVLVIFGFVLFFIKKTI